MFTIKQATIFSILFFCTLSSCSPQEGHQKAPLDNTPGQPSVPQAKVIGSRQDEPGFKRWSGKKSGISLAYPDRWELMENFSDTTVLFRSPQDTAEDNFQENLNLVVRDIGDFGKASINLDQIREPTVSQLKMVITDFKLLSSSSIKVAQEPALLLLYTGRQGVYRLHFSQYVIIRGTRLYVLTFVAEKEQFPTFKAILEQMITGVRWI